MSYPASQIANEFVKRAIEEGNPMTQMKLQKVLYFAQGIYLAGHTGEPLLDEFFQAWKYGPVIPEIYHEYKLYGSHPITDLGMLLRPFLRTIPSKIDKEAWETLDTTWNTLKGLSAVQLSNWTHQNDSPWSKYYIEGISDQVIPNQDIQEYFQRFFNKQ